MSLENDGNLVRFRCSCGEGGSWFDRETVRFATAMVCLRWSEHAEEAHGVR